MIKFDKKQFSFIVLALIFGLGLSGCVKKSVDTVEVVSTADWQTYSNEEYGFEFKYPNGWYIDFCDIVIYDTWIILSDSKISCNGNLPDAKISLLISNRENIFSDYQISRILNYKEEEILLSNLSYHKISGDMIYQDPEGNALENIFLKVIHAYIPFNEEYIVTKFHMINDGLNQESIDNFINIYENLVETVKAI